ncbi:MAG: helix-turn-helix transcriptional regulator [Moraxellaceae bacterium]|nr:helix-turn-helix transcriptional regulator [Moraxellaceae bacterium]
MSNFTIGQRILEIRGKEPRRSFAEKLGIGTATLQRYENDERSPDLNTLLKLSDIAQCSLDDLVNKKTENSQNTVKLTADEAFLLQEFRSLQQQEQRLMLKFLIAGFDGLNRNVINSPTVNIENSFNN